MTRYKGRASLKSIGSKYSHRVDMMVPEGGFGGRLNAMHKWHDAHGIPAVSGQSRREGERDIIRWCFADSEAAKAFAKEFGVKSARREHAEKNACSPDGRDIDPTCGQIHQQSQRWTPVS